MNTGNEADGCGPEDLYELVVKAIRAGSAIERRCRHEETRENYETYVRAAAHEHFSAICNLVVRANVNVAEACLPDGEEAKPEII